MKSYGLTPEEKKIFIREFRIEEGWVIIINNIPPIPDDLEDEYRPKDALIFTASNPSQGKNISVYYKDNEVGYLLDFSISGRKDGQWDYNNDKEYDSVTN